jgi:RNA polymerase sigma-70 factor, ECF subfamily
MGGADNNNKLNSLIPKEDALIGERLADAALVRRAQQGDNQAFNLLVLKYQIRLERVIARYVRDPHEVFDLTQETFIKAYRGLDQFRGTSSFYTWVYRIAVNTAKNYLVALTRRPPDSDVDAQSEGMTTANYVELRTENNPEHLLLRDEIERTVFQVINTLPLELRIAIILRELEGMSYEEIAEIMHCPLGTVRSRIFRAREAIDANVQPLLND